MADSTVPASAGCWWVGEIDRDQPDVVRLTAQQRFGVDGDRMGRTVGVLFAEATATMQQIPIPWRCSPR
jgi:hypothetical protein